MIEKDNRDGGWYFRARLINYSLLPVITHVSRCKFRVGDEVFEEKERPDSIALAPNEKNIAITIGHINQEGIRKIRNKEYNDNTVNIKIELYNRSVLDKEFKHTSTFEFDVDVLQEPIEFKVIKQEVT
ncbi:MAG: hypothetical protein KAU21_07975 [Gammaproteobacteria bacterium]|nr:hypothetical protein [Gammaproteobacteria bacterium]